MFKVYEDVKNVFIVTELMRGGELLDRIVKHKSLSERETANIMFTLSSALAYLHNEGVSLLCLHVVCLHILIRY